MKRASSASNVGVKPATRASVGSIVVIAALLLVLCGPALAAPAGQSPEPLYLLGIPVDFILFALTLLGVALFHHHTLQVALTGLAAIVAYKLGFTGFKFGPGLGGLALHMQHEWVILANLFLLLMGFALLSRHFEKSKLPDVMPAFLPDDWKGALPAARDRLRAVELPRQHRRRADRRRDGARGVQRQGAHRLSRRHRRRLQCRRRGQRGRRHDHHHDVDRRRQPAQRGRGLSWRLSSPCSSSASPPPCSSRNIRRS